MSTKKNKPQWLIDAEKAMEDFSNTKYANMTDANISRASWAKDYGIGKKHEEGKTKQIIQKGLDTKKKKGFYQSEAWLSKQSKKGKKGGAALVDSGNWKDNLDKAIDNSLAARKVARHEKYTKVLNYITKEEFSAGDIKQALLELGYEKAINIRFMIKNNYIEKCYIGTPGSKVDVTRYKRIS